MSDSNYHAFEQSVPLSAAVYAKVRERLGSEPLDGLVVHVVVQAPDSSIRYVDVWKSKEACDRAFRERIHPAVQAVLQETGFQPSGEPKQLPIDVIDVLIGK